MSGIIARALGGDCFQGREVSQHAYPSELGKTLWHLYRKPFKQDRLRLLEVLIDEHPGGWIDLATSSWTVVDQPPTCLCHSQNMPDRLFTETTPSEHRWCYRIGVTTLYKAYMDIFFRPSYETGWHIVGSRILLQESEPNWYVYEGIAANFEPPSPVITTARDVEQLALSIETAEDIEQQAQAIEAWAQKRGPDAIVWFRSPMGGQILIHPDHNHRSSWLSTRILPVWGTAFLDIPIPSRVDGIRMALTEKAQVQAES